MERRGESAEIANGARRPRPRRDSWNGDTPDGDTPARIADEVASVLARSGALAALGLLNARTRFRFTGVYHAEPPLLRNVLLYDRENPRLNVSGDVSRLDDTYCSITCASDAPFTTADAPNDPRLSGHAARGAVLSYGGVPIHVGGSAWGTLCHFDVRPRLLPAAELTVLEAVAPLFARWVAEREGGP